MASPQTLVRPRESQNGHTRSRGNEVSNEDAQRNAIRALVDKEIGQQTRLNQKAIEHRLQAIGTETRREEVKIHVLADINARITALQTVGENLFRGSLGQDIDNNIGRFHPRKKIPCDRTLINLCAEQFSGKSRGTFLRIAHRLLNDGGDGIVEEDLIPALNIADFPGEDIASQLRRNCWQQNH